LVVSITSMFCFFSPGGRCPAAFVVRATGSPSPDRYLQYAIVGLDSGEDHARLECAIEPNSEPSPIRFNTCAAVVPSAREPNKT